MDIITFGISLTAFFIAAFLKGLTGLGFSTLCLGFLALFIDIKIAIPMVFLPSLSSNFMVMLEAGHFMEAMRRFWLLFLSAVPGLLIGIWFLSTSQTEWPKIILGMVMLIYGVWGLFNRDVVLSHASEKRLILPVGIVSGLINGSTGSQIMPIMPYLLSLKMDRNLFVQTINCAFTINTLIMMVCLGKLGMLSRLVLMTSAIGILFVGAGIFLGSRIRKRVSEAFYRKMVLIFLIVLGAILALRPLIL